MLAFAYSFWMIYGAGQEYIAQGFLLLMAGIPVYVYIKWRQWQGRSGGPPRSSGPAAVDAPAVPPLTHGRPVTSLMSIPTHQPVAGRDSATGCPRRPLRGRCTARRAVHRPGPRARAPDAAQQGRPAVRRRHLGEAGRRQEHDAFVDALAERDVEVLEVRHLLAETIGQQRRARRGSRAHARRRQASGRASGRRSANGSPASSRPSWRSASSAASHTTSCRSRARLLSALARRGDFALPPLPNHLFTRDTSAWIYGGVCVNHMAKPARVREALHLDAIYRHHPRSHPPSSPAGAKGPFLRRAAP